jgi:hypothetical protein
MASPIERFDRWRARQAPRTASLGQRVLSELVPLYEAAGLGRFPDYASGDTSAVGANTIALQRRAGERWPTVEVQFHPKGRASFNIIFAELPELCHRWTSGSPVAIDRKSANVVEGAQYFALCKGCRRDFDCTFGIPMFALFPARQLASEFDLAKERSLYLIELFETGIPASWATARFGYVSDFVFKHRSQWELRNGRPAPVACTRFR